jgi:DNA topoisomerase I
MTRSADADRHVPASLHYSSDRRPGIRRVRRGRGFGYLDVQGRTIRDREVIERIRSLAIPPAWTDVWICPSANGHLQATGRDARGRKQYRYHPRYRAARERAKYDRLTAVVRALPRIRRRVRRDLRRRGLPREKVLATIVQLLEWTLIRVGNREYARDNQSYGLTTLRGRHARVEGSRVRFRFRGKGGRTHEVDVRDRRLARIVRSCQDLPGQELFQYLDEDGNPVDVRSEDVNDYLRDAAGEDVTAKDFRTWAGTLLAYRALRVLAAESSGSAPERESRKALLAAVRATAARLGNTAAVCRKSYIHPAVLDAHLDGRLADPDRPTAGNDAGSERPSAPDATEAAVGAADAMIDAVGTGDERAMLNLLTRMARPPRSTTGSPSRSRRGPRKRRAAQPRSR